MFLFRRTCVRLLSILTVKSTPNPDSRTFSLPDNGAYDDFLTPDILLNNSPGSAKDNDNRDNKEIDDNNSKSSASVNSVASPLLSIEIPHFSLSFVHPLTHALFSQFKDKISSILLSQRSVTVTKYRNVSWGVEQEAEVGGERDRYGSHLSYNESGGNVRGDVAMFTSGAGHTAANNTELMKGSGGLSISSSSPFGYSNEDSLQEAINEFLSDYVLYKGVNDNVASGLFNKGLKINNSGGYCGGRYKGPIEDGGDQDEREEEAADGIKELDLALLRYYYQAENEDITEVVYLNKEAAGGVPPTDGKNSSAIGGNYNGDIGSNNSEFLQCLKELINLHIRPMLVKDGGDIRLFRVEIMNKESNNGNINNNNVNKSDETGCEIGGDKANNLDIENVRENSAIVHVRLLGACKTCPSSEITLRYGVERIIKHFMPEVAEVKMVSSSSSVHDGNKTIRDKMAAFQRRRQGDGDGQISIKLSLPTSKRAPRRSNDRVKSVRNGTTGGHIIPTGSEDVGDKVDTEPITIKLTPQIDDFDPVHTSVASVRAEIARADKERVAFVRSRSTPTRKGLLSLEALIEPDGD